MMKNRGETNTENHIIFNNANALINKLKAQGTDYEESFLTMVQGNSFSDVEISEPNIHNNAQFIVDLWD